MSTTSPLDRSLDQSDQYNAAEYADRPLPCGASPAALLEQVADEATPAFNDGQAPGAPTAGDAAPTTEGKPADQTRIEHQRTCLHCRAMLAELRELWRPVAAIAATPITAPPSLARGIMERVTALAQNSWHAVVEEDPGVTRIAAWVVAVVARRAAASVPGVTTVAGRVHPADSAVADVQAVFHTPAGSSVQRALADGVGVAGRKVVVRVQVTAGPQAPMLAVLGEQVRRAVIAHVRALTGLAVVEVDVHIDDIDLDR